MSPEPIFLVALICNDIAHSLQRTTRVPTSLTFTCQPLASDHVTSGSQCDVIPDHVVAMLVGGRPRDVDMVVCDVTVDVSDDARI